MQRQLFYFGGTSHMDHEEAGLLKPGERQDLINIPDKPITI